MASLGSFLPAGRGPAGDAAELPAAAAAQQHPAAPGLSPQHDGLHTIKVLPGPILSSAIICWGLLRPAVPHLQLPLWLGCSSACLASRAFLRVARDSPPAVVPAATADEGLGMHVQEEPGTAAAEGIPAQTAAGCEHMDDQRAAQQTTFQLDMMMLDEQPLPGDSAPTEQLLPDQPAAEELSPEEWQHIVVRPATQ